MVQPGSFIHSFLFHPNDFGQLTIYVKGHSKHVLIPNGRDITFYNRRYMLFDGQLVMYRSIIYCDNVLCTLARQSIPLCDETFMYNNSKSPSKKVHFHFPLSFRYDFYINFL